MTDRTPPGILDRLWRWVDNFLPMPPDQRAELEDGGEDRSEERKLRLRLHMLSKRGKGGPR